MPTHSPRLHQLLAFYEEDPQNPFNLYGLALEYQKTDPEQAAWAFRKLLKDFPEYLPAYYQAAHFFAERGDVDQAKRCFEQGIELSERNGQEKAQRELRGAFRQWLDEWEC